MRSRHFCCCLPVRLGAFVLSLLGTISYAFVTFGLFFQLHRLHDPPKVILIPAIVFGVISALGALFNLFGFIGTIVASLRLVRMYSRWLTLIMLADFVCGLFYIVFLFTHHNTIRKDCLDELDGVDNADDICHDLASTNRWIFLACWVVQLLVQLYLWSIVRHYVQQLEDSDYSRIRESRSVAPSLLNNQTSAYTASGMPLQAYKPVSRSAEDQAHGPPDYPDVEHHGGGYSDPYDKN